MTSIDNNQQLYILAEPESVFLPGLVDILARKNKVKKILVVKYRPNLKQKINFLSKHISLFGIFRLALITVAYFKLRVFSKFKKSHFFSLKTLARLHSVPYLEFDSFDDPKLIEVFRTEVKATRVFTQVNRRVPQHLVNNYFLINKHCSLLPALAGIYPVFWAMLKGFSHQGVTIYRMNEVFDRGPIISQIAIANEGSFFSIYGKLYALTAEMLIDHCNKSWEVTHEKENVTLESSYFSYPTRNDRINFLNAGKKFGYPNRSWTETIFKDDEPKSSK